MSSETINFSYYRVKGKFLMGCYYEQLENGALRSVPSIVFVPTDYIAPCDLNIECNATFSTKDEDQPAESGE